ncbi:MAG: hypothetical protein ING36_06915 [Burkholderiales bacterium]|uniref:hypothetical protein n=2 Tax=unclassified Microcystis TaxID=2643300 RepID=UPI0025862F91|nr:hypothetical protein [Microcystis sp. M010S1]MCA2928728.1 hypothetical protein [Microcystis sp. M020S1]MCA2935432.1 hypothetical protein [Microcystis sp. M015S1]MCA3160581.1 hypothetical protein [Burkholderiales bacterium]MCA2955844.1 hypothetical protein [Microcystis sp. M010S1]MCA3169768.1 hypothetical protein [Burkholderiales bacterium]
MSAEKYAQWIVENQDKQGTPEFETVAAAYKAARNQTPQAPQTPQATQEPSLLQRLGKGVADYARRSVAEKANLAAGAVRGASSIGATLLTPYDLLAGNTQSIGNPERRQAIEEGLRSMGADPESAAFQVGKIGTEIAGTAGAGSALAKGLGMIPGVASRAPALINALRTSGMTTGAAPVTTGAKAADLALRAGAAGTTGALAGGMINPEDTGTSAAISTAIPLAAPVARQGATAARKILGTTTGVGDEALSQAFQAGKAGGTQAQAFRNAMRPVDDANMMSVLDDAMANLDAMRKARTDAYKQNMAGVKESQEIIDMTPIQNAFNKTVESYTFKGQARNPRAAQALQNVSDEINAWQGLNPVEYHTPEGLDALKQRIGSIRESLPFEDKSARAAVDNIYASIKKEIATKAPIYSKTMQDYTQASEVLEEVTRSLSLNEKATADTALRKLQSVMRNNANTNYGARLASVRALEEAGGRPILPQLAGQALSDWTPRGIQRATAPTAGAGLALAGNIPAALAFGAMSSPRIVGETMYGAGRLAGLSDNMVSPEVIRALRQGAYRAAPVLGAQ